MLTDLITDVFLFFFFLWLSKCAWIVIVVMGIMKTENRSNRTDLDSVWFGSIDMQKMNRLVDILYQSIGSVLLIFGSKPNQNRP